MTITRIPSTTTSHQPLPSRLDPETAGRSDKQSPNRAGIPMPRAARVDSANGANDPCAMPHDGLFTCVRWGF